MDAYPKSSRNQVHRLAQRGVYDRQTIFSILDEGSVCHVGFVTEGQPFVIPCLYGRDGEEIILHGAKASRMLTHIGTGAPVCITVTHVDGLVLARSVFEHSVNYRSAVIFGKGWLVEDPQEKYRALEILTEHILPGRWKDARPPNQKELNVTAVARVTIEDASAKIRSGPPKDKEEDLKLPTWAGVLPLQTVFGIPQPDATQDPNAPLPGYIQLFMRR